MKKSILLSLAVALAGMSVSAQDTPNRMIVYGEGTSYTSYVLPRVQKVGFATVEGTVACDVKVNSFTNNSVNLDATLSDACTSFTISLFPGIIARSFVKSPDMTQAYMQQANAPRYYEDFVGGQLSGVSLDAGTEYAVVTQGYDLYNTPCDVRVAYFTTKSAELVGDPKVECKVLGASKTEISFNFVANADVKSYYYVIFKKGSFDQQYEQFAPMFGFTSPGQMITMWGTEHSGNSDDDYTYTSLDPNTEYELYIQPLDKKGNYAPLTMVSCATQKQGGSGEAAVNVTLGDYRLNDWGGEMLPSQFVTYTPNDQAWCYRFNVLLADQYDADPAGYKADLQTDPEMDMAYWFFYEPMTTDYQINPNTAFVIIASAKNADGVWGPINEVRATTPAKTSNMPAMAPSKKIEKRAFNNYNRAGRVPETVGVSLTH